METMTSFREDVVGLKDLLAQKLVQLQVSLEVLEVQEFQEVQKVKEFLLQARQEGICQKRRELFSQCWDEIIRQTTISCEERGLLLLRYLEQEDVQKLSWPG